MGPGAGRSRGCATADAAHLVPDVLVDDLRTFYGKLR
jgi:hypothetical protein